MAKRSIIQVPDPILYKKTRQVEIFDGRLHELLDDLKETLQIADGAGLAAPQVGVLKSVCIVSTSDGFYELINPVILSREGEQTGLEGCLSLKGKYGTVTRANEVSAKAQDRYGNWHNYTVSGFTARAFLHEVDHLNGIVFTVHSKDVKPEKEWET